MAVPVTLPSLGESVTEGTVTRWLKQPGEEVQADEPLLEVSTDKVDTEIPAPSAGVLLEIKVGEDETVAVGAELAIIGDRSEAAGDSSAGGGGAGQEESADGQGATQTETEPAAQEQQPPPEPEPRPQPQPQREAAHQEAVPEPQAAPPGQPAAGDGQGTSVTLPSLGESVTEGTVTRWLKQPGDQVQADEPLLEVSTDKVDTEIPAPASGVLLEIKVGEDETVSVGTELALIGEPSAGAEPAPAAQQADDQRAAEQPAGEQPPLAEERQGREAAEQASLEQTQAHERQSDQPQPPQPPAPPQAPQPQAQPHPQPEPQPKPQPAPQEPRSAVDQAGGEASPYVTPLVRKLASEHSVDLSSLRGSGVGGRIRKQDVLAAAESARSTQQERSAAAAGDAAPSAAPTPSPLRGRTEKMSRLRSVIAQRMVESLRVAAQLTTVVEVDVTPIARLRQRAKADFEAREGVKLTFLPFFAKATVDALKQHPMLNATIDTEQGEVSYFDVEHLGVAVDTERGLLVPVLKNAGDLNIAGLARKIADLADRTRRNKIGPDELSGGTFTITNTGSRGALFDTPIINQPQVAILGTGSVVKRPVVIDDAELGETIAVRSMAYLALTYDHRLVDGADAARFLEAVKQRLEAGGFEADLGL